jgi:hypothetical protein
MDPGSYFRELIIIISFSVADPDSGSGVFLTLDAESAMEKS